MKAKGGTTRPVIAPDDDLAHGQNIIVTFRWILVAAGLIFAAWNPSPVPVLRIQFMVILGLAAANFYLHAQLLRGRPSLAPVAYAASAADLTVITLIIMAEGGFNSGVYIFYYPAIMGLAVAFPGEVTALFTGAAIVLYGMVALATADPVGASVQVIVTRLLMLAAAGACGHLYWRIEGDRRRTSEEGGDLS